MWPAGGSARHWRPMPGCANGWPRTWAPTPRRRRRPCTQQSCGERSLVRCRGRRCGPSSVGTSLRRAWAAARASAGDAVLYGTCGTLDRSAPLDALITAIVDHLRAAGPDRTAEVLGPDAQLLGLSLIHI